MCAHFHSPRIITNGLVLALDAANVKSYPGSGTVWKDLSGNNNNGTLVNGVGYNSGNLGYLAFDGTYDYVSINYPAFTSPTELSIGGFFRKISGGSTYETVLHQSTDSSVGGSAYWFGVDSTY